MAQIKHYKITLIALHFVVYFYLGAEFPGADFLGGLT